MKDGNELTDDIVWDTLKTHGKQQADVEQRERMEINVQWISGEMLPYAMETQDIVGDIKTRIQASQNVEPHQILLSLKGTELHDEMSLGEVKDQAASNEVTLVAKEREEISVQMWTGETEALDMEPTATVLDVKKKVSVNKGVDASLLRIIYKSDEMPDEKSLESIQQQAGSNYYVLACKQKMIVNLCYVSGKTVTEDLNTTDSIVDVKQLVETKDGVPKEHVKLTFRDIEFTDDKTLWDVRKKAGSNTVDLIAKERVVLNVKTPKGLMINHDMCADDTFDQAKDRHT